jgi:hypothetical protein
MDKHCLSSEVYSRPLGGGKTIIPLESIDRREKFLLDLNSNRIKLSKMTYMTRARVAVPLVRLDIDGPPHTNPDRTFVPCPHLHIYREGYDMRWATPVDVNVFTAVGDFWQTLAEFQAYCHITVPPQMARGMV